MHLESLAPCSQEEADGRTFLHAADAAQRGNDRILIRTVDTDVVVLAVTASQRLSVSLVSLRNREELAIHLCHCSRP